MSIINAVVSTYTPSVKPSSGSGCISVPDVERPLNYLADSTIDFV
jgi:hypothetical protein